MKVNYRQLSIMTFISFIALKLLALPSLLYVTSGNMGWFVALILMLIDGIYAVLILDLMQKNQNKNVYEFMVETLGVVLTKIFLFSNDTKEGLLVIKSPSNTLKASKISSSSISLYIKLI